MEPFDIGSMMIKICVNNLIANRVIQYSLKKGKQNRFTDDQSLAVMPQRVYPIVYSDLIAKNN